MTAVNLSAFLITIGQRIQKALVDSRFIRSLPDGLIKDRILDYALRGGKFLRPALVYAAAGAVGGDPNRTIPMGVAIEMFHIWTLVHDDIIDRDDFRRGGRTTHAQIYRDFADWSAHNTIPRKHLAHSLAILIGDAQHGLVMDILVDAWETKILPADIVLTLIAELEGRVLPALLTGEVSDILQSGQRLQSISVDEIQQMLQRKTGALLQFAGTAGGVIGLNVTDPNHPYLSALSRYGESLGLAFQLRDDILGIMGTEEELGKPICSDFREGKRTIAIKLAYDHVGQDSRNRIERLLGNPSLAAADAEWLTQTVIRSGALNKIETWSRKLINTAHTALEELPCSEYRDVLTAIAEFCVTRRK